MARTKQPPDTYRMALDKASARRARFEEPDDSSVDLNADQAITSRPTAPHSPAHEALSAKNLELQEKGEKFEAQVKKWQEDYNNKGSALIQAHEFIGVQRNQKAEDDGKNRRLKTIVGALPQQPQNKPIEVQRARHNVTPEARILRQRQRTIFHQQQTIVQQPQTINRAKQTLANQPQTIAQILRQQAHDAATSQDLTALQAKVIAGLEAEDEFSKLPNAQLRNVMRPGPTAEIVEKIKAGYAAMRALGQYKPHA